MAEKLAATLPAATVLTLLGAGHNPHATHAAEFAEIVARVALSGQRHRMAA